jgi:hypothetical protein
MGTMDARRWSFDLFSSLFYGDVLPSWNYFVGDTCTCGMTTISLCIVDYVMGRILFLYSSLG